MSTYKVDICAKKQQKEAKNEYLNTSVTNKYAKVINFIRTNKSIEFKKVPLFAPSEASSWSMAATSVGGSFASIAGKWQRTCWKNCTFKINRKLKLLHIGLGTQIQ